MIDNHEFRQSVRIFKSEVQYLGYRAANMLKGESNVLGVDSYSYTMNGAKSLASWVAPWLGDNGRTRTVESFLQFYSELSVRHYLYTHEGIAEHEVVGNREFAKLTANLMTRLAKCVN